MQQVMTTRANRLWVRVPSLTRRQLGLWTGALALRRVQLLTEWYRKKGVLMTAPHTIHDGTFTSEAVGRTLPYTILLPADFDAVSRYPVLYLLHGASGHHTDWPTLSRLVAHAAGLPLVIVCPEGENSCYINGANGERWEDMIVRDLPAHIEGTYPVRSDRGGRAIAGLSMGGFGAFNLGMRHPERYRAISTHSGAFMMNRYMGWMDTDPQFAAVLGPVDSPVQREYDPQRVIAQAVQTHGPDTLPMLAMDTGTADSPMLIASNRTLHRTLTALGVRHTYRELLGGHTWEYWDREVPFTLQFVAAAMGLVPAASTDTEADTQ